MSVFDTFNPAVVLLSVLGLFLFLSHVCLPFFDRKP
jgi:hypothetical protein